MKNPKFVFNEILGNSIFIESTALKIVTNPLIIIITKNINNKKVINKKINSIQKHLETKNTKL